MPNEGLSEETLLPCPFCGGKATVGKSFRIGTPPSSDFWQSSCVFGCARSSEEFSRNNAIAAWNRRPSIPDEREAIARIIDPEAFATVREVAAARGLDASNPPPGVVVLEDIDAPISSREPARIIALAKADAILARRPSTPSAGVEEVLKAARNVIEDAPQAVERCTCRPGRDIDGSEFGPCEYCEAASDHDARQHSLERDAARWRFTQRPDYRLNQNYEVNEVETNVFAVFLGRTWVGVGHDVESAVDCALLLTDEFGDAVPFEAVFDVWAEHYQSRYLGEGKREYPLSPARLADTRKAVCRWRDAALAKGAEHG